MSEVVGPGSGAIVPGLSNASSDMYYSVLGQYLYLTPVPSGVEDVTIFYSRKPRNINLDADDITTYELEIDDEYIYAPIYEVCMMLCHIAGIHDVAGMFSAMAAAEAGRIKAWESKKEEIRNLAVRPLDLLLRE